MHERMGTIIFKEARSHSELELLRFSIINRCTWYRYIQERSPVLHHVLEPTYFTGTWQTLKERIENPIQCHKEIRVICTVSVCLDSLKLHVGICLCGGCSKLSRILIPPLQKTPPNKTMCLGIQSTTQTHQIHVTSQ